jgi:predicted CopG family antitoxin
MPLVISATRGDKTMAMLSIEISDENYQKLEKLVQGTGISVSDIARMLVDKSFDQTSLLIALGAPLEELKDEGMTFEQYIILRQSIDEDRRPDAPRISLEEMMGLVKAWASGEIDPEDREPEPEDAFLPPFPDDEEYEPTDNQYTVQAARG